MKAILATLGGTVLCSGMLLAQSNMPSSTATSQTSDMQARTSPTNGRTFTGLLVAEGCDTSGSMNRQTASNLPATTATEMSEATMSQQSNGSIRSNEANVPYEQRVNRSDRSQTSGSSMSTRTTTATDRNTGSADRVNDPTMAKKTSPKNESNTTYEQSVDQSDRKRVASSAAETNASVNRRTNIETGEADRSMPNRTSEQDMNTRGTPNDTNTNTSNRSSDDTEWAQAQQIASQMPNSCRISTGTTSYALRLPDGRLVRFDEASNAKIQQQLQSTGRFSSHSTKIYRVVVKGALQGDTISVDSIQI